jgi:hypothetical protein
VKYQGKPPLDNQHTLKNEGHEGKTDPVQEWVPAGGERVRE